MNDERSTMNEIILAIEASGALSSVAILSDQDVWEERFESRQRLSQELVPRIRRLLASAGHSLNQVGKIAVSLGPGSFTSLRIGVSTANALAHALRCPVVGVGTLDLLAQASEPAARAAGAKSLCIAVDSRRAEAYAALFRLDGRLICQAGPTPVPHRYMGRFCDQAAPPVALCGVSFRSPEVTDQLSDPSRWRRLDAQWDWPSAAYLARMATNLPGGDPGSLSPIYLHPSQAEAARGEGPRPWRAD